MAEISKQKILAGRKAVDAYRTAHTALHSKPWHRGIPEEHTPLLNIMLKAFKEFGFNTIQELFDASMELNIQTFKECYTLEGNCCHSCHGIRPAESDNWGCLEDWYQRRMKETKNETLEPLITADEVRIAYLANPPPQHLPPACTYKIVKIKEPDIDWEWD